MHCFVGDFLVLLEESIKCTVTVIRPSGGRDRIGIFLFLPGRRAQFLKIRNLSGVASAPSCLPPARWTDYLSVGNAKVGRLVINIVAATISTRYFRTDHLGSRITE